MKFLKGLFLAVFLIVSMSLFADPGGPVVNGGYLVQKGSQFIDFNAGTLAQIATADNALLVIPEKAGVTYSLGITRMSQAEFLVLTIPLIIVGICIASLLVLMFAPFILPKMFVGSKARDTPLKRRLMQDQEVSII